MAKVVREVMEDSQFLLELSDAGTKLVVVDFFAIWPCELLGPTFEEFSLKYPMAVFLKVDVDKCSEVATSQNVSLVPTFKFYRNKMKIDEMSGANTRGLEERIKKWIGGDEDSDEEPAVKGFMDLVSFISKSGSECLNESDNHPFSNCLQLNGNYLESDCDEQLIMSISFNQPVRLHSLKMHGPEDNGPKTVQLFINQPSTLDFDQAESMDPIQLLSLTSLDIEEGAVIPLRFVKFQNVQSLTIFVKDNQSGSETTQINYLGFIGNPVSATNMSDFKRVAGKKGESH